MVLDKDKIKLTQKHLQQMLKDYFQSNPNEFAPSENDMPWFQPPTEAIKPTEFMNKEVLDLYHYLTPTAEENKIRNHSIQQIIEIIKEKIPQVEDIHCYGSHKNHICLPTSDIDLVIKINEALSSHEFGLIILKRVAVVLKDFGLITHSQEIFLAKIPIVKCVLTTTGYQVDIGFDCGSSLNSFATINRYLDLHPMIRPLVILTKHLLYENQLERVYSGGLSSFSTVLLVTNFCQMYITRHGVPLPTDLNMLGTIWLKFMEFYGSNYDCKSYKLSVSDTGEIVKRAPSEIYKTISFNQTMYNENVAYLWIVDPDKPDVNIAKGSFRYYMVEQIFRRIPKGINDALKMPPGQRPQSFLQGFVKVRWETVVHRLLIRRLANMMFDTDDHDDDDDNDDDDNDDDDNDDDDDDDLSNEELEAKKPRLTQQDPLQNSIDITL